MFFQFTENYFLEMLLLSIPLNWLDFELNFTCVLLYASIRSIKYEIMEEV